MKRTAQSIRDAYLNFFTQRGHVVVPSAPLVPENDATTLFISSGMQPLLQYFLGTPHPLGTRVVNSQNASGRKILKKLETIVTRHFLKCWAIGHLVITLKQNRSNGCLPFLTKDLKLDPSRLFVTVFAGSDELGIDRDETAIKEWQKQFKQVGIAATVAVDPSKTGMGEHRIGVYLWKNWWSRVGEPSTMPAQEPGGPDSEVFMTLVRNENCMSSRSLGFALSFELRLWQIYGDLQLGFYAVPQTRRWFFCRTAEEKC